MNSLINWSAFICLIIINISISHSVRAQSEITEWKSPAFADTLTNPLQPTKDHLKQGEKIYLNTCASCHGYTGKGDGPASLSLDPKPADHTNIKVQSQKDGSLFYKIATGRGLMQPYSSTLSAKQRWQLVLYIRSLAHEPYQ